MSDYINGIRHAIDVISGSLDNEAIDFLPSKITLQVLIASLNRDIEDIINVGG